MGQSISLFLVRISGLILGSMLMFAAFKGARANDLDNYGLKPLPEANPTSATNPVPTNNGHNAAPAGGGYPPQVANGYAPVPVTSAPPASNSVPAGYYPALNGSLAATPAPASLRPAQAEPVAYGYKPVAPTKAGPQVAAADPYAHYQPAPRGNVDYVLGPADRLRLTVYGETDLSGEFTVDGSGYVRLPLIGQVRAAGYTSQQLERMVGGALAQGYMKSPRVSVEVATYRPFYIIGAVNRPGQYAYVDHMSALNAVALAGGFAPTAVESVVFVRREGSNQEVEVPVDRSTLIYPGDVVKVHNTIFADAVNFLSPFSGVAASAATAAVIQ
ncbi:MAG TPA: polysaccharide biosynthesis/export family protein [Rhizomicrobium sp.]|jgi:polysaccharide export outer membrane protein